MTRLFVSLYFLAAFWVSAHESNIIRDTDHIVINIKPIVMDSIRITYYTPSPEECYGNPLITANGTHIDTIALRNKEIKYCAISRDLEEIFPMGSEIEVYISDGHRWNNVYKIVDRTSSRLKKTIDILSNTDKGGCYRGKITEI